jgi:nucleoside-diphosphate-sugar epimerase
VLVTGGAGTIGSTIVDQLLDARVGQVRILDNLTRGRRENLAAYADGGMKLALFEGPPLFSPPNDQAAHRTWRSRHRTATGRTTMKVNLMPAVNNNGASAATERIPIAGSWVTDLEVRYVAEAAASV